MRKEKVEVKAEAKVEREAKWITFQLIFDTGKTKIWEVMSKEQGVILGAIKWYGPWRRYSFFPQPNAIFEKTCLREIADYCDEKTKNHFEARKKAKEGS